MQTNHNGGGSWAFLHPSAVIWCGHLLAWVAASLRVPSPEQATFEPLMSRLLGRKDVCRINFLKKKEKKISKNNKKKFCTFLLDLVNLSAH